VSAVLSEWIITSHGPVMANVSPLPMKSFVRHRIVAAFPVIRIPAAKDAIAETHSVEHLHARLGGRSWDKPTVQDYRCCEDGFSLLTVAGLKYYLPGYLVAELDDPETADVIAEYVTYTLGGQSQFCKERLDQLGAMMTEDQIVAIALWLGYYSTQYGIDKDVRRSYDTLTEWANKTMHGNCASPRNSKSKSSRTIP